MKKINHIVIELDDELSTWLETIIYLKNSIVSDIAFINEINNTNSNILEFIDQYKVYSRIFEYTINSILNKFEADTNICIDQTTADILFDSNINSLIIDY